MDVRYYNKNIWVLKNFEPKESISCFESELKETIEEINKTAKDVLYFNGNYWRKSNGYEPIVKMRYNRIPEPSTFVEVEFENIYCLGRERTDCWNIKDFDWENNSSRIFRDRVDVFIPEAFSFGYGDSLKEMVRCELTKCWPGSLDESIRKISYNFMDEIVLPKVVEKIKSYPHRKPYQFKDNQVGMAAMEAVDEIFTPRFRYFMHS